MKFNEAWDKIYDTIPEDARLRSDDKDNVRSAKIMSILWSMLSLAMREDEKRLDDIAYIDNNMNIVSVSIADGEKPEKEKKNKKGRKPKKDETEDIENKEVVKDNVEETEESGDES